MWRWFGCQVTFSFGSLCIIHQLSESGSLILLASVFSPVKCGCWWWWPVASRGMLGTALSVHYCIWSSWCLHDVGSAASVVTHREAGGERGCVQCPGHSWFVVNRWEIILKESRGGGGGWPFVPLEPALLSLRVNTGCPRVNFIGQEPQNHPIMYVSWGYWKICSKWGVFLLLSFESYMCSLYTQVLHQRHDLHIFLSQSEANYFILLVMPFTEQVWLLLIKSNLSLFFLIQILLLMSTLRTFCLALGPEDFLLCFL